MNVLSHICMYRVPVAGWRQTAKVIKIDSRHNAQRTNGNANAFPCKRTDFIMMQRWDLRCNIGFPYGKYMHEVFAKGIKQLIIILKSIVFRPNWVQKSFFSNDYSFLMCENLVKEMADIWKITKFHSNSNWYLRRGFAIIFTFHMQLWIVNPLTLSFKSTPTGHSRNKELFSSEIVKSHHTAFMHVWLLG